MAPVETFLAISKLLTELTGRIQDGATASLVRQVQSNYETIQASYFAEEKKALERQQELARIVKENEELHGKLAEMQETHAREMATLKASHESQVTELRSIIAELEIENTAMKTPQVGGGGPGQKAD